MNEFSTPQSNSGLLQDVYKTDKSPLQEALKRKREKLAKTLIDLTPEEEKQNESSGS